VTVRSSKRKQYESILPSDTSRYQKEHCFFPGFVCLSSRYGAYGHEEYGSGGIITAGETVLGDNFPSATSSTTNIKSRIDREALR
jgi:hypothetical protein